MNTAQTAKTNRKRPLGKDMIAVNIVGCLLIGVFAFLCVVPFYLIIIASFTSNQSIIQNGYPLTLTANALSLQSYQLCLKNPVAILQSYGITIFVTVTGTFCAVMMACMTGYVLSRRDFPWRNKFAFFYFFTTLFNGGLVPWYLLCVRYLNFKNSFAGLLFPLMFSVWNMIIAKSFMIGLPAEITESAKLDGANDFTIFLRLIMPLSKPLVATLSLFSALAYWNDWYQASLYIESKMHDLFPLQYVLVNIEKNISYLANNDFAMSANTTVLPSETMRMAIVVIAVVPIMFSYPFFQKYFISGLTIGAVKG